MTRSVPTKTQIMRDIAEILGSEVISPTRGSSIPRIFFSDVASHLGIPQIGTMPELARRIIEFAHLEWHDDFSSELAPSGGGGTVTALGLLQIKNAVLVWKGLPQIPLPQEIIFEEWEPALDWEIIRSKLPREETDRLIRPGASDFRDLVLNEYGCICAISGCSSKEVIEIAHIVPYHGEQSDEVQNAIPLRSDLHALFDCGMLKVNYSYQKKDFEVQIHENVIRDYEEFNGVTLKLPKDKTSQPSKKALKIKNELFSNKWLKI